MKRRTRQQRSDAARKGWVTRRENERRAAAERARRSVAARKGWDTRKQRAFVAARVPVAPPDVPMYDEPLDDFPSDEWEIGFEYRGADRGSHVDVNIRIAREDGAAFGVREASDVLRQFRENLSLDYHNPVPAGYVMAFIDWKRPRWGTDWQSGGDDDLVSFHAPMYVESNNPSVWSIGPAGDTRLGSVKK